MLAHNTTNSLQDAHSIRRARCLGASTQRSTAEAHPCADLTEFVDRERHLRLVCNGCTRELTLPSQEGPKWEWTLVERA